MDYMEYMEYMEYGLVLYVPSYILLIWISV